MTLHTPRRAVMKTHGRTNRLILKAKSASHSRINKKFRRTNLKNQKNVVSPKSRTKKKLSHWTEQKYDKHAWPKWKVKLCEWWRWARTHTRERKKQVPTHIFIAVSVYNFIMNKREAKVVRRLLPIRSVVGKKSSKSKFSATGEQKYYMRVLIFFFSLFDTHWLCTTYWSQRLVAWNWKLFHMAAKKKNRNFDFERNCFNWFLFTTSYAVVVNVEKKTSVCNYYKIFYKSRCCIAYMWNTQQVHKTFWTEMNLAGGTLRCDLNQWNLSLSAAYKQNNSEIRKCWKNVNLMLESIVTKKLSLKNENKKPT